MDNRRLINASMGGFVLAGVGIGLFIVLYIVLGAAGATSSVRLFGALCAPPVVIGVIVLAYGAIRRDKQ